MSTKNVFYELRAKSGLTQDELAEKVYVTRQAVSRWENGETVPNTETLKLLSSLYNVSINTLLGSPRKLICQCCGMPLDDTLIVLTSDHYPYALQNSMIWANDRDYVSELYGYPATDEAKRDHNLLMFYSGAFRTEA